MHRSPAWWNLLASAASRKCYAHTHEDGFLHRTTGQSLLPDSLGARRWGMQLPVSASCCRRSFCAAPRRRHPGQQPRLLCGSRIHRGCGVQGTFVCYQTGSIFGSDTWLADSEAERTADRPVSWRSGRVAWHRRVSQGRRCDVSFAGGYAQQVVQTEIAQRRRGYVGVPRTGSRGSGLYFRYRQHLDEPDRSQSRDRSFWRSGSRVSSRIAGQTSSRLSRHQQRGDVPHR